MLHAFLLAWLVLSGSIVIWQVILLSFIVGCINSFEVPAHHSFVIEMVASRETILKLGRLIPAAVILFGTGLAVLSFSRIFSLSLVVMIFVGIGTPFTILAGGVISVAGALNFLRKLPELRQIVRPIYVKMGIIPEVAEGIQNASESEIP
jgi:hypothetical protein